MSLWIAVTVLGIIEGITEFLPISSTGHLLLTEHWLGASRSDLFNVVIQCGAVLAVIPLFPERLKQFVFQWRERSTQIYALKLGLAFFLTGIGGLLLEKQGFKLPEKPAPIAWALLVGGIGFLAVEFWLRNRKLSEDVTWTIAFAVGIGQLIAAVFPGTSRSGATILLALLLGLNRVAAVEFTFLVGIPTMLAAGALKTFKAIHSGASQEDWPMVLLGFVVAGIVSFVAVKWLLRYIQTHTFVIFGWYRIALATVIVLLLWN